MPAVAALYAAAVISVLGRGAFLMGLYAAEGGTNAAGFGGVWGRLEGMVEADSAMLGCCCCTGKL